jgi:putative selenate reductase
VAELRPYPFPALLRRIFAELRQGGGVLDLPPEKRYAGFADLDLSVSFHGHRAATPLGPAAGPHTQLAQNIVSSWLIGSRVIELKTVQVLDRLSVPRPCIDMRTVGYNVEWSQELSLEQSLEEYVKAAMTIEILRRSGDLQLPAGDSAPIFDMSVGYDLAGIQSDGVQRFIDSLLDAEPVIDRLRKSIPFDLAFFRDLDFASCISDTLTLSTFHGCPSEEIEEIASFLMREKGLHCVVKLNPTLLGSRKVDEILRKRLGYEELRVPAQVFEEDTTWEQMAGFVERLVELGESLGRGFGVKFTNTLVVENNAGFLPTAEGRAYLSGAPLHVLATTLVRRFRRVFGTGIPISFSAGVDRHNFADMVALGLVPVTTCTDLLRPGGYGRGVRHLESLADRMHNVGARNIPEFMVRTASLESEDGKSSDQVDEAALRNTEEYTARATIDARYSAGRNSRPPHKIGVQLELFDCTACDKCVPVCPNGANFVFFVDPHEIPIIVVRNENGVLVGREDGLIRIEQEKQYGNFADFCNLCGNCDVFCPEDGGPYLVKPRFFGSLADWHLFAEEDGFALERTGDSERLWGRIEETEYSLEPRGRLMRYTGPGFSILLDPDEPLETLEGEVEGEVELTPMYILRLLWRSVYTGTSVNYLNSLDRRG